MPPRFIGAALSWSPFGLDLLHIFAGAFLFSLHTKISTIKFYLCTLKKSGIYFIGRVFFKEYSLSGLNTWPRSSEQNGI